MAWDWREDFLDLVLASARRASTLRNRLRRVGTVLPRPRFEKRLSLRSGSRLLDARWVPARKGLPVVLICHGIGDTLDIWDGVQALFEERGIGSMGFSYSGYGKSTGRVRARHYGEDFLVAHEELLRQAGAGARIFVLGYSLGRGVAASGIRKLAKMPAGLFLCSGFSSFREAGIHIGFPRWLTQCVPDLWRTIDVLTEIEAPVVVVHSDGDGLFSMRMAEKMAAIKGVELIAAHGFSHSDPMFQVAEEYWLPIAERMLEG